MFFIFTDDEQGEEEQEADSEHESGDESDCVITDTSSNFMQSRFETSLDNSILLNTSVSDDDPIVAFFNNKIPSVESFNKIQDEDKLKAFKEHFESMPEEDYLTYLVFAILKLSSIGGQSQEAKTLAQQLFKEAFEYGRTKDRVSCAIFKQNQIKHFLFGRSKASETSSLSNLGC